ncbi:MAG: YgeY family selenium metabolism-linked hydrolase [Desulfobacterium sp.]|nr:YgeY family selenium metabolism-linked hydrolase [Desulfobacterium sp.]
MNDRFIEDCQGMVQCPSESGHEEAAAIFAKTVMERLGFDRVWIDDVGNVLGQIKGNGPTTIMLEGHLDTVGIGNRSDWTFDPHGAEIHDGRMYGRGTSDMKCALMAMIHGAAALIPFKNHLCGNIVVAGVVCEEEFEGVAQGMILDEINPDLVIIGEASELSVKIGQRGRAEVVVITHGKSAHSSNPSAGINAVKKMNRLLGKIETMELPRDEFLGPAIIEVTDIRSEPYPGSSVIPSLCRATFDRRLLPGETEAVVLDPIREIIQGLKAEDPDFSAEVSLAEARQVCYTGKTIDAKRFFPAWRFSEEDDFVKQALAALGQAGLPEKISHYSFCTDGSQCAGIRGIPTLGFGPSRENLAHVVDEYVEIDQLEKARTGYTAIVAKMLNCTI